MVISAIGIFLVSTFSMKETSYEEALAKQRKELEKTNQHKIEKKKKEKPVEKKGKAKKKEEKPNGKIPEQQLPQEGTDSSKDVVLEPAVVPEPVAPVEPPIAVVSVPPQEKEKPAPSPKEKRKKEKKVAKVEPAPSPALASPPVSVPKGSPVLEVTPKEVPVVAVPPVGTQQSAPIVSSVPVKKNEAVPAPEEQKHDGPAKKKAASKKKAEPGKAKFRCVSPLSKQGRWVSLKASSSFSGGEKSCLVEERGMRLFHTAGDSSSWSSWREVTGCVGAEGRLPITGQASLGGLGDRREKKIRGLNSAGCKYCGSVSVRPHGRNLSGVLKNVMPVFPCTGVLGEDLLLSRTSGLQDRGKALGPAPSGKGFY